MQGETELRTLLETMMPVLHEHPYVFCSIGQDHYKQISFEPLGTFREQEGITVIVTEQQAQESGLDYDAIWACITLTVHSSLSAVGFLAAVTAELARAGIPVNPVSAYYHDHLFVPWESREMAMEVLGSISGMDLHDA